MRGSYLLFCPASQAQIPNGVLRHGGCLKFSYRIVHTVHYLHIAIEMIHPFRIMKDCLDRGSISVKRDRIRHSINPSIYTDNTF